MGDHFSMNLFTAVTSQLPPLPEAENISPLVTRILGGNPGKFTLQGEPHRHDFPFAVIHFLRGTNTYLVGNSSSRILIDTGEGKPSWSRRISSLLSSQSIVVSQVLITHWHPDHVGGVKDLRSLCPNAHIHKHDPGEGQATIYDGQIFKTDGATLRAFHCPGHTTDHMAFVLDEENAMFTGDNVLGHGTAVFENLAVYLDSLSRMREQFNGRVYPGHGAVVEDGPAKLDDYLRHRKQREEETLKALSDIGREATPIELVKIVYNDVPQDLHAPAANGVTQVLEKLEGEGKVNQSGHDKWRVSRITTL